ncbi:MAG: aminotransferase class I/II-fold pyridoxal phosphate-dependent enzyme [Fimbriimonas sp.]|nr:aminotransferase class I/II-fold pyridoxal phosphate-dependent enzyme [Fimbriimonas sp.]
METLLPPTRKALDDYESLKSQGLTLDLTRGKPSAAQLDLSSDLLSLPGSSDFHAGNVDCRNYGGLLGLDEARALFSPMMGAPADQVIVSDNSSLALMHDTIAFALLKGVVGSGVPWSKEEEVVFLCPTPGYDRHFTICEELGIKMVSVGISADGPDMNEVESLVASDPRIKGMWCMPKYSNPTGSIYSDETVERLASMKTAAPDFRLWWDNAYGVHHLTDERVEISNILERCTHHGNPNRTFVFASTSKITLPGAGLAMFASSKNNVSWLNARFTARTIGPDKLNQLRHVRLLKDHSGIVALMERHRDLIAPKFQAVLGSFERELSAIDGVEWTEPKGGYFITLQVPAGCAKRVVSLAKEAGIALTPAGSTHPYKQDAEDRTIRIAPTFPELEKVSRAADGLCVCVRLAVEASRSG